MSFTPSPVLRTETFECVRCGLTTTRLAPDGVQRDHCPGCLHSRHVVDQLEGGPSECLARMMPIAIAMLRTGEWRVIHRCVQCGELASSRTCGDDNQLILMRIAVRPLADPPFPLESFGGL